VDVEARPTEHIPFTAVIIPFQDIARKQLHRVGKKIPGDNVAGMQEGGREIMRDNECNSEIKKLDLRNVKQHLGRDQSRVTLPQRLKWPMK
jgi:hypothetical protein